MYKYTNVHAGLSVWVFITTVDLDCENKTTSHMAGDTPPPVSNRLWMGASNIYPLSVDTTDCVRLQWIDSKILSYHTLGASCRQTTTINNVLHGLAWVNV